MEAGGEGKKMGFNSEGAAYIFTAAPTVTLCIWSTRTKSHLPPSLVPSSIPLPRLLRSRWPENDEKYRKYYVIPYCKLVTGPGVAFGPGRDLDAQMTLLRCSHVRFAHGARRLSLAAQPRPVPFRHNLWRKKFAPSDRETLTHCAAPGL